MKWEENVRVWRAYPYLIRKWPEDETYDISITRNGETFGLGSRSTLVAAKRLCARHAQEGEP